MLLRVYDARVVNNAESLFNKVYLCNAAKVYVNVTHLILSRDSQHYVIEINLPKPRPWIIPTPLPNTHTHIQHMPNAACAFAFQTPANWADHGQQLVVIKASIDELTRTAGALRPGS